MNERTHMQMIEEFADLANNLSLSPFEHHHGMHLRSLLEEEKGKLFEYELKELKKADEAWKRNAKQIVEHVSRIWNFDDNPMPAEHWWWHLSKFIKKGDESE